MAFGRQFVISILLLALLLTPACEKKKKPLVDVSKLQVTPLEVRVPDRIAEEPLPEPKPAQPEVTAAQEPPQKPPPKRHISKKPPTPAAPAPVANTNQANATIATARPPMNPVVEPPDPAIAAGVSSQQLSRQKQNTTELLDDTEKNLKGLNRGLSHDEEVMLAQIKSYVSQSRDATREGDFERAYNLAMKAHLLADALIKK